LHGHWAGRLAAIVGDIDDMQAALDKATIATTRRSTDPSRQGVIYASALLGQRPTIAVTHEPPVDFVPGESVRITVTAGAEGPRPISARLHYRQVNQPERFVTTGLDQVANGGAASFTGEIPGDYTLSLYPLLYYVDFQMADGAPTLSPGCDADLANQSYVLIRPRLK
jgi:hypothetical protein